MESKNNININRHGSSRSQGPRQTVQRMQSVAKLANASCLLIDTKTSTSQIDEDTYVFSRCGKCKICDITIQSSCFKSTVTQKNYKLKQNLNCKSQYVIYLFTCTSCGIQYVGKTIQQFKERAGQHVRKCDTLNTHFAKHFRQQGHNMSVLAIDKLEERDFQNKGLLDEALCNLEVSWMKELHTIYPYGLNERVSGVGDVSHLNVNVETLSSKMKRRRRSHGRRKRNNPYKDWSLSTLISLYKDNDPLSLHNLRTAAYGLPNKKAHSISGEALGLFYSRQRKFPKFILRIIIDILDRKLYPPKVDDETMGQKRRFLTLFFHNKGMDLINLPKILHNKNVLSTIPDYFVHHDPPAICYKYTRTIAGRIFNHKNTCGTFDIDEGSNVYPCVCESYHRFIHPQVGHVVTGNLDLIKNIQLRDLLKKGPKFREQNHISWSTNRSIILDGIDDYIRKWAKLEHVDIMCLQQYKEAILKLVDHKISSLKRTVNVHRPKVLSRPSVLNELDTLQNHFVLAPADKAANNVIFVCKKWYMDQVANELNVFSLNPSDDDTYQVVENKSSEDLIEEHNNFCDAFGLKKQDHPKLPCFYGLPKMHKQVPKLRFIAASCGSPLKPIDITVTKCLDAIYRFMCRYCKTIFNNTGTNRMWILENSLQLKQRIFESNETMNATHISTWDFSTLYTTIPHGLLKDCIKELISFSYKTNRRAFIAVNNFRAFWSEKPVKNYACITQENLIDMVNVLIDNIYVTFGNTIHKQKIGIPMGISCAPLLANLFLMLHEYRFMERLSKVDIHQARNFNFTLRYIDDLICLNNENFEKYIVDIYPKELSIKKENDSDIKASYLDLLIQIKDGAFHTSLYDKRDDFNFSIVNYPHVDRSNIPTKPAYGVYSSRLVSIARACDSSLDFNQRHDALCIKLMHQGYKHHLLKKQLNKTIKNHHSLFSKYQDRPTVPLPILAQNNKHVTVRS